MIKLFKGQNEPIPKVLKDQPVSAQDSPISSESLKCASMLHGDMAHAIFTVLLERKGALSVQEIQARLTQSGHYFPISAIDFALENHLQVCMLYLR